MLATRNPEKLTQIRAMFNGALYLGQPIRVADLDEMGVKGEAIEDGKSLGENAIKKIEHAQRQLSGNEWIISDDTGVFINALGGQPGIKAARWAGENATTDEITQFTLKMLDGIKNRWAIMQTAVALVSPNNDRYIFRGTVGGRFLEQPRGKAQPKMPYSTIFVPDGETKVWAEMETEYENRISHRGIAFRASIEFLGRMT